MWLEKPQNHLVVEHKAELADHATEGCQESDKMRESNI